MAVEDKLNINLNQNLWGLVVTYVSLGVAEHWQLPLLLKLSLVMAIVMSVSVFFTVSFYTWNYCRKRASLS